MQGSGKTSAMRDGGSGQEWGRKDRKAEAKHGRAAAKARWKADNK